MCSRSVPYRPLLSRLVRTLGPLRNISNLIGWFPGDNFYPGEVLYLGFTSSDTLLVRCDVCFEVAVQMRPPLKILVPSAGLQRRTGFLTEHHCKRFAWPSKSSVAWLCKSQLLVQVNRNWACRSMHQDCLSPPGDF